MNWIHRLALGISTMGALLLCTGCGMQLYPGQPGITTNGYSKIDLEDLQFDGLWVYEINYDNRATGKGVAAIVTKLYPNALTYTSNVRTNADGTLYRAKGQYVGAEVQMISLPKQNQIMMPPETHVVTMISYKQSLDEVDDVNIAERNLFKKDPISLLGLSDEALSFRRFRWDLLRAGRFKRNGNLSYDVTQIEAGAVKFTPASAIRVETNFWQNGIRTNVTKEQRLEAAQFIEKNFPKGYDGLVKIYLKGVTEPLSVNLGLHTPKTAEAAGVTVSRNVSQAKLQETLTNLGLN